MTRVDKSAPLTVLPCPNCGGRALVSFSLLRLEVWGRIYCSQCTHSTKTTTYREAKAEWNAERQQLQRGRE